MPYKVFKVDTQWCVYKLDGDGNRTGDTLGCHDSEEKAQRQVAAIYASENANKDLDDVPLILKSNGVLFLTVWENGKPSWERLDRTITSGTTFPVYDTIDKGATWNFLSPKSRLMLLVTSNAYRDREQEIVRQKAWQRYVEGAWQGGAFSQPTPLLFWHAGDPIGEIIYADMEGPFLIEVARELEDKQLDIMRGDDKLSIISRMTRKATLRGMVADPTQTTVKAMWDALEKAGQDWAASPEFAYLKQDRADKMYEVVAKKETSVLPRENAANFYTLAEVRHRSNTL